jgi:phosphinothricin acetyltransferase
VPESPVHVRSADIADAAACAGVYAPYVQRSVASFETVPPDGAEMARRMLASPRLPWLVATRDDAVVGYAYASHHRARAAYRWSVDVSVYVAEGQRGRGIGRLLYGSLLTEVQSLGYVRAFAGITLPNDASVGLHEAMSFVLVGVYTSVGFKHGSWHDVGWWQRPLCEPPADPADPTPWSL